MSATEMTAAYHRCPSYDGCSTNRCPLDPLSHLRPSEPEDLERDCRAHRPTRLRIVAELRAEGVDVSGLPLGGLTHREDVSRRRSEASRARFEAMTPDEQETHRQRFETMRQAASARRSNAQAGAMSGR